MSYIHQFKTLLWKNWKIFKKNNSAFSVFFELFFTFLIVGTLCTIQEIDLYSFDLLEGSKAKSIKDDFRVEFNENFKYRYVGFVLPKNQVVNDMDSDSFITEVMNDSIFQQEYPIHSKIFETEQQLIDQVVKETFDLFLCGVIFGDDYTNYTISTYSKDIIDPNVDPQYELSDYKENVKYGSLFTRIQYAIDNVIIQWKTNRKVKGINVAVGSLSEHERNHTNIKKFDHLGPYLMFIIIGQLFHLSSHFMEEKENKIKEGLVVIGVNPVFLSFTWTLIYFPLSLILVTMIFIFDPCHITSVINILLYYLLLICYIIAMYSIVIVICNIAKNHKTVIAIICLFVSIMLSLPEIVYNLQYNGHMLLHRILSAIFPFFGLSMAAVEISHEYDMIRQINFSNMFDSEFGINFIFVVADSIFYLLLAIFMC